MNTNCICSIGNDVPDDERMPTITLLAGTSSVSQSYTILDNPNNDVERRRFIVEAIILDPILADFMVGNDLTNLRDRDSAILAIVDDDGELLRSICL